MNHYSSLVVLALLSAILVSCSPDSSPEDRPNVILIMTDDQGYGDLACHGNEFIETPNLDDFHSESVRFTDFHVNPFCAPTRAALMTGRFSDLTHVRTTINGRNHLNVAETSMAEYFKATGYATGQFGKWHLGQNYPFRPMDRGFDYWLGHGDGGIGTASDYWGNDKMNDSYMRNGKWEKFEGFSTDIFFNEAIHFIDHHKDAPFFIYLATNVPHSPWNIQKEWGGKYEEKSKQFNWNNGSSVVDFYATISRFDDNFGRLRTYLDEQGLSENTIIIFLTDNGTAGGNEVYNAGMKGKKGSVYEGGHRVPCFLSWPAKNMNTGIDLDRMTAHIDILPTLIDLCNLKTPEKAKFELSGQSWLPLLKGEEEEWQERAIYLHSQNVTQQHEKWKNSLVAREQWRLVNQNELYNIKADPSQKLNVAQENPDVVADLQERYEQYWKAIGEGKSMHQRVVVGSGKIEETWLCSDAWIPEQDTPHTWDQSQVNRAVKNFGYWPLRIAQNGNYVFEVRRWPKEVDCSINDAPEVQAQGDIFHHNKPVLVNAGSIVHASKVKLRLGEEFFEKKIGRDDRSAVFYVDLGSGELDVQAWLIDSLGNEHPAYYVYINKNPVR